MRKMLALITLGLALLLTATLLLADGGPIGLCPPGYPKQPNPHCPNPNNPLTCYCY